MSWLKDKLVSAFGGGAVHAHTLLIAQKKVLNREGQMLLAGGIPLEELSKTRPGLWIPDGKARRVVKDKKVTDDFCEDIVDTMQSSVAAFSLYKYHHSGTGAGAESEAESALVTPREDARVVGSQVDGASAKEYKSIATITYTDTWAIIEHAIFNTAGAGGPPVTGGRMMDRTLFAAINVVATNAIEFTFTIAFTSGG